MSDPSATRRDRSAYGPGRRRELRGTWRTFVDLACAVAAVWTIYQACFASVDVLALAIYFICIVLSLVFLVVGATPGSDRHKPTLCDLVLSGSSVATGIYFSVIMDDLSERISLFTDLTASQFGFGILVVCLVLEATRRTVGNGLLFVIVASIIYNLWGDRIDGYFGHGAISVAHLLDVAVYTVDGIFGVPARVAATYAFMFVLFGTLLEKAGGGDFFYNLASLVSGNRPGGPAKIAVVSSGMFGAISGSPTSDVITTGSVTIPSMKRSGYSAILAGAIEVAASTGGSLLPPVMGAAAFVMAEYTGIAYVSIAAAALIPALLFYAAVMMQVHLLTLRQGLTKTAPLDTSADARPFAQWPIYLIPAVVLVATLFAGYSPTYAGLTGSIAIVATSQFAGDRRIGPSQMYAVLARTMYRILPVSAACAGAGLVIAGITMTGLSQKFSYLILVFGSHTVLAPLVVGALITIVLGMGMTTSSAYILSAILVAPVLISDVGLPVLGVHMFLFYFAVLSALTPPIAVAAYAAATIAEANPMAIGFRAMKLAISAVVVPFAFVYNPALLLAGHPLVISASALVTVFAIFLFAVAAEGYLWRGLQMAERVVFGLLAASLLAPLSPWTTGPIAAGVLLVAWHWFKAPKSEGA